MRPWHELNEGYREANRHQADHIAVKLRATLCEAAPFGDPRPVAIWSDDEVELLAKMEHRRWNANRWLEGWSVGPRDDANKRHPNLVEWQDLDDETRDYDRKAVRQIPELLELLGLKVVRAGATTISRVHSKRTP
jgi:hypothetical protein